MLLMLTLFTVVQHIPKAVLCRSLSADAAATTAGLGFICYSLLLTIHLSYIYSTVP